jgi:hypothetical protein
MMKWPGREVAVIDYGLCHWLLAYVLTLGLPIVRQCIGHWYKADVPAGKYIAEFQGYQTRIIAGRLTHERRHYCCTLVQYIRQSS